LGPVIKKTYETDPLVCPKCQGPTTVISLLEDPAIVNQSWSRATSGSTLEALARRQTTPTRSN
jgi:hypothetical protein